MFAPRALFENYSANLSANPLYCGKVRTMQTAQGHTVGSHERALMSEVFAMQCSTDAPVNASAGLLAQNPMSRRNDAYTAIYYFRYC